MRTIQYISKMVTGAPPSDVFSNPAEMPLNGETLSCSMSSSNVLLFWLIMQWHVSSKKFLHWMKKVELFWFMGQNVHSVRLPEKIRALNFLFLLQVLLNGCIVKATVKCVSQDVPWQRNRERQRHSTSFFPFFLLWLGQQMLWFRNKIKSATFISWALNYGYIVIKLENSVR